MSQKLLSENFYKEIKKLKPRYPTNQALLLPALHLAQKEYGWIAPEIMDEVAHAIDGLKHDLSETKEWERAWKAEISDGGFLGPDSTTNAREGFSEFGAMLLGSGLPAKTIAEVMPQSVKFWKDRRLL